MIGSGLSFAMADQNILITEFNRNGIPANPNHHAMHFEIEDVSTESDLEFLSEFDVIVNAAGIIRHKILGTSRREILDTIHVNSMFPQILDQFADSHPSKIIQVGTDCVYSGSKGGYRETDQFDPTDTYGITKLLGERNLQNTMTIRVSVVGKEICGNVGLFEWALAHPENSEVKGFVNHQWNGVTPLQLARIFKGIINLDKFSPGVQHIVPSDSVSKLQLIQLIRDHSGRSDLKVTEVEAMNRINRTLDTVNKERNLELWTSAGYAKPPRIEDMICEYTAWAKGRLRNAGVQNV